MSHPLLAKLASADPEERCAACREAAADPAAALLADALARALGDREKRVARAASDALARIGAERGGVEKVLRAALGDADPTRRYWAAFTAARLEPPGLRLVPALVQALAHPDGDVRWSAARILVEAGRLHPEVLGVLLGLAGSGEVATTRRMASHCLRELAPDLPQAAQALLSATRDPDAGVRRAAYTAMAGLMDPPPAVAKRLEEALGDADPAVRRVAQHVLHQLGLAG